MTDLGGNLDILSTFRLAEKLLLDLIDHPADGTRLTWDAHHLWWRYFDELNAVLQPLNPGNTAWAPIFSAEPYYMLQCDFCYMGTSGNCFFGPTDGLRFGFVVRGGHDDSWRA